VAATNMTNIGQVLLVIALTDDRGRLVWVSAVRPGRTSEITACRHDKLTAKLRAAGLGAIADLVGLDDRGPDADPVLHLFSMTHHVECVAILEPAAKGS